jgi:hypothetical protein
MASQSITRGKVTMKARPEKKHKISITLSHGDFSMLEKIGAKGHRNKSRAIAWLIFQEWERLQEQEREKTPAEIVESIGAYVSRVEKKIADRNAKIIQFPIRYMAGTA